jgi:hypothetical protein
MSCLHIVYSSVLPLCVSCLLMFCLSVYPISMCPGYLCVLSPFVLPICVSYQHMSFLSVCPVSMCHVYLRLRSAYVLLSACALPTCWGDDFTLLSGNVILLTLLSVNDEL